MFRQKTTIVVGAGASCEIGLPSGEELKDRIVALLATTNENAYGLKSDTMINAVKWRLGQADTFYASGIAPAGPEAGQIKEAAKRIGRGLPLALSIDNFLHSHQDDPEVVRLGKTAIAMSILDAESRSALFENSPPAHAARLPQERRPRYATLTGKRLSASWYAPFAQLLMSQVQKANAGDALSNLRFVVFNYDRCLECYLSMALQSYFDITISEAAELLAPVEFLHPYGSLGPLPWQDPATGTSVPLGGGDGSDVWAIGSRIRTFTESVASEVEPKIKLAIESAETIILLGFGYLDQNVQLLTPGPGRTAGRVMSTAYGVSNEDQLIVRECMEAFGRSTIPQIMVEPGSCREFFDRFRLQLSLR